MTVNSTKEVIEMNMPLFTAEATLYNSVTPYRSSCFSPTEIGLHVTPQLGSNNWPEVRCRVDCWTRFRAGVGNWDNLKACLNECG